MKRFLDIIFFAQRTPMGTVLRFIPATQFTDVPLIAARATARWDTVGRGRSAWRKADIDHGPLQVKG